MLLHVKLNISHYIKLHKIKKNFNLPVHYNKLHINIFTIFVKKISHKI